MDDSTGTKLNYDILVLVSHLLVQLPRGITDVSGMSQTCRHLYLECAPLLLSPRRIRVHGDRRIESFCRYMLSDIDRRVHRLSQCPILDVGGDSPSESVADLLVETLAHITTLPWLRIHQFEEFMSSSPRVFQAFAAFPGTHYLEIELERFPGKWSYAKFLKATVAPLKGVRLSLRDYDTKKDMGYVAYSRNLDPLWLFSSLSPTLEFILLDGRFTAEACSTIKVYPRLTHFTIHHCCMPLVRPYIQAFPSLHVLQFDLDPYAWPTHLMPTDDVQEITLRHKKAEDLRRHNREDQLTHGSWPALKYYMGMTLDAYIAGLTCRIHTLHLVAWGGSMEGEVSAICAVFADARPSIFRLALRPQHIDYIPSLFSQRPELFSSLTSLELRVDVTEAPFDFKSYLDGVGTALQQLSIISLQVEIKCWAQYADRKLGMREYCDNPWMPGESGTHCYTLNALSGEDMDGRLRYFLEKIRTLRRVTIAWGRCRVDIPHHFMTVDLDSIPHTVDRPGRPTDLGWHDGYCV
ncbi:hypothetical protein LXA43DRAFT_1050154 [Ganoderma leucocontextum]|nr:hypothetical protein LXA43DRAFT_1050154 [Ganoderma leucocontextum]